MWIASYVYIRMVDGKGWLKKEEKKRSSIIVYLALNEHHFPHCALHLWVKCHRLSDRTEYFNIFSSQWLQLAHWKNDLTLWKKKKQWQFLAAIVAVDANFSQHTENKLQVKDWMRNWIKLRKMVEQRLSWTWHYDYISHTKVKDFNFAVT